MASVNPVGTPGGEIREAGGERQAVWDLTQTRCPAQTRSHRIVSHRK